MKRLRTGAVPTEVRRFVGIALGGGKSDRTALTVIDYYHKQKKAFVIDVYDTVGAHDDFTADDVLIDIVQELGPTLEVIGVDAPITLPPCASGCAKDCRSISTCRRPAVKWMRGQYLKAKGKHKKLKNFTPYTQRPVDVFFRYQFMDQELFHDESLGANRAPQAARMQFLKTRLGRCRLVEAWPKLTLFHAAEELGLSQDEVIEYRNLEEGIGVREDIIEGIAELSGLFVYDRDAKKIAGSLIAFDSFITAWVAMLAGLDRCVKFKKDIPKDTGWIELPEV